MAAPRQVPAFYAEDGVAPQLALELQHLGYQATTADLQGHRGLPDEVHLWLAAQQQWVLITHNIDDFRMLHRAWHLWQVARSHGGILIVKQFTRGLAQQAAQAIDQLARGQPGGLGGQLHEWEPRTGWRRYPP